MKVVDFLTVVPDLFRGRREMSVLLATYNSVDSPGMARRVIPPGLAVTIRQGKVAFQIDPRETPGAQNRSMERQARRAIREIAEMDGGRKYDLVVVYAGLTGFHDALDFGAQHKKLGSTVVILTCDCEREVKAGHLAKPAVAQGLDYVLWTKGCGGQSDMGYILERIEEAWPGRSVTQ